MRRLLALLALAPAAFAQGPENVLVVFNLASPVSRRIADYYVVRRAIPRRNVCGIDAPPRETITRDDFERTVVSPIAHCLESRRLVEQILYIATTLDVPLRIEGSRGKNGTAAAVDSELALLYADLHSGPHAIEGALQNPFFGRLKEPFHHQDFPIYLVCRLAAYDFEGVKAMIDRSLEARNRGRVVLDMKSNDASAPGDDWLSRAAGLIEKGRVVLDDSTRVLEGERQVIGYAGWGSNDPNHKQRSPHFEWLPGAIATQYVSTDGRTFARPPAAWKTGTWRSPPALWFAGSPQSMAADLLAEGATGVSAHVDEPFLQLTPRPDILFPAYLSGRTLAESFYLALPALSWQNIVLGDPLCRLR